MDQRTRMIAVLTCLAASMTGTAGLLAWMDPFAVTEDPIPEEQLMEMARATVADAVAIDVGRWHGIDVFGAPASGFLSAVSEADSHFVIDVSGRFTRARSWVVQQIFDESPSTVRIQVAQDAQNPGVSVVQWASTRALVKALLETIPLDPGTPILNLDPQLRVQQARSQPQPSRPPVYLAG